MTYHGEPRRPAIDPLLSGVEAVAAGYRTVEYVFDAFAESVRRQPGTGYGRGAPPPRAYDRGAAGRQRAATQARGSMFAAPASGGTTSGRGTGSGGYTGGKSKQESIPPAGGLAHLAAELLDLLSDTVREVADGIGGELFGDDVPKLRPHGFPGETAELKFHFTNTGSSVLKELDFEKTKLLGDFGGTIKPDQITFKFESRQVDPEGSVRVDLKVDIPAGLGPGIYRGVIVATSTPIAKAEPVGVGAWALVELEIPELDASYPTGAIEVEEGT